MWQKLPDTIRRGVLEGLRTIALAIVSYLLTIGVINTLLAAIVGTKLDPSTQLIIVGLITSGLKAIDKWLHEIGVQQENLTGEDSSLTKGLTRF